MEVHSSKIIYQKNNKNIPGLQKKISFNFFFTFEKKMQKIIIFMTYFLKYANDFTLVFNGVDILLLQKKTKLSIIDCSQSSK